MRRGDAHLLHCAACRTAWSEGISDGSDAWRTWPKIVPPHAQDELEPGGMTSGGLSFLI